MQSILSRVTKADVRLEPFPHVVVEHALNDQLFKSLSREFPATEIVTGGVDLENKKMGLGAVNIIDNPDISATWKNFVVYHSSAAFFREVIALFGDEIDRRYPFLEKAFESPLADLEPRRRIRAERKREHSRDDVVVDCQIMLDDTRDPRICRGPHVDAMQEIYAGILYFRHPDDLSEGGDLCLLRSKRPADTFPTSDTIRVQQRPAEIDDSDTEIVTKIPYAPNTAVLFLNGPRALHKVTMRSASPIVRRHVNVIGETYSLKRGGLFRILQPGDPVLPLKPPSMARRILNRAKRAI